MDVLLRFGKYIEDGRTNRYLYVEKVRDDQESGTPYKTKIVNNEFVVEDEPISIKGRYASLYDAIIGMKYQNDQELRAEEVKYQKSISQTLIKIFAVLQQLKKNN